MLELGLSEFRLQAFEQFSVGALSYSAQHEPPTTKNHRIFLQQSPRIQTFVHFSSETKKSLKEIFLNYSRNDLSRL